MLVAFAVQFSKGKVKIAIFPGGHSGEETPVPIPNTEVKLPSADGTAGESLRESRSLPGFLFYVSPVAQSVERVAVNH